PPLTPMPHAYFQSLFGGAHEKSTEFAKLYGDLADFMKVHFLDAGAHITTDGVDGIHFTPENNRVLGEAIAAKVRAIFAREMAA
ncbi:MAG: hydrolase, partial [Pseudomonadota bacterium]